MGVVNRSISSGVSKSVFSVAGMQIVLPDNLDDWVVLHLQTQGASLAKTPFGQTGPFQVPSGKQLRVHCGLYILAGGTATNGNVRIGYADDEKTSPTAAGSFTNLVMWGGGTTFGADNAFDAKNKGIGDSLNEGTPINFVIPALKYPVMAFGASDIGVGYAYCILETL